MGDTFYTCCDYSTEPCEDFCKCKCEQRLKSKGLLVFNRKTDKWEPWEEEV